MPLSPQEPTAYPSRRSLREARLKVEARESADARPVVDHAQTDAAQAQPHAPQAEPSEPQEQPTEPKLGHPVDPHANIFFTKLPEYQVRGPESSDAASHPTPPARPARRRVRKLAAATFSLACVGTLAVTTTLPAFSSAFGDPNASAARAEQQLQSPDTVVTQDALGAIGSVELGVDPGSYKQITPEAGLVDPATLENTEIRNAFDRDYPLTDGFAYRTAPVEQFHDAQDIAAPGGTPVSAIGSGVVIEAGYANDGCGFSIKLQHKVSEETLTSRYCHMQVDSHDRKVGDKIEIGDFIGRVGNTGMSFGDHLHLALRRSGVPIDPLPYIQEQIDKSAKRAAAKK